MMTHTIVATLIETREAADGHSVPVSTEFWRPLVQLFLSRADHFRIDCWNEEDDAQANAALLGVAERPDMSGGMTVFEGRLSATVIRSIISRGLDGDGTPRWFSLFLHKGEEQLFSSEHYGTRLTASGVCDEDLSILRTLLPASAKVTVDEDE